MKLKCELLLSFHQVYEYIGNLGQIMPTLQNTSKLFLGIFLILFCYYFIESWRAHKKVDLRDYKEE